MGYSARVDGELEIVPPLPWKYLKDNPYYLTDPKYYDMRIEVDEEKVDTPEGELVRRKGISVGYGSTVTDIRAYVVMNDVAEVLKHLPEGTTLKGWLDCIGEDGAIWRIAVQDGRAVKVEPEIVWPEWIK
jgi:hypothetical protein